MIPNRQASKQESRQASNHCTTKLKMLKTFVNSEKYKQSNVMNTVTYLKLQTWTLISESILYIQKLTK